MNPDFNLEFKDQFDEMVSACYKARILKFFGKSLNSIINWIIHNMSLPWIFFFNSVQNADAENYAGKRRRILPKSYRINERPVDYLIDEIANDEQEEDLTAGDAEKLAVRALIQQKIAAMNDQFVDLDDSEIENIQELFADDDDVDKCLEVSRKLHITYIKLIKIFEIRF